MTESDPVSLQRLRSPAPGGASDLWFTKKYEAAENYLWENADGGTYNVLAIFGDDEACELAADALNKAAERVGELESQNLALIERLESLQFREMELREALVELLENYDDDELTDIRAKLAKAPYQRKGEAE